MDLIVEIEPSKRDTLFYLLISSVGHAQNGFGAFLGCLKMLIGFVSVRRFCHL